MTLEEYEQQQKMKLTGGNEGGGGLDSLWCSVLPNQDVALADCYKSSVFLVAV